MIERYSLPEMAAIWSSTHKTDTWLQVELLVCEGWAREGVIPTEAIEKIRRARYNAERMRKIEQETHHDVISFLRSIQEQLGPEGRFIHLGLTSSDVLDTGLAAQIKEAGSLLTTSLATLIQTVAHAAVQYKYTLMVGRTHGIHAEPITFGLKLALWMDELRRGQQRLASALEEVTVGKISGAVGTHATVPPQIEEYVCEALGLGVAPISSQIVQRDRHAHFITSLALARQFAGKNGPGDSPLAAYRTQRSIRAVRRRSAGIVSDAAQAQPRTVRAHLRTGSRTARIFGDRAGERRPLA